MEKLTREKILTYSTARMEVVYIPPELKQIAIQQQKEHFRKTGIDLKLNRFISLMLAEKLGAL